MSLPVWWPRVSCVYCGARTDEPPPILRRVRWQRSLLACWRHVYLIGLDPCYPHLWTDLWMTRGRERCTVPLMQAANGEAVQTREGTGSR